MDYYHELCHWFSYKTLTIVSPCLRSSLISNLLVLSISVSPHCVNSSLLLSGFKLVCFAALVCLNHKSAQFVGLEKLDSILEARCTYVQGLFCSRGLSCSRGLFCSYLLLFCSPGTILFTQFEPTLVGTILFTGSNCVNKIVPGEQNRSKYEQNSPREQDSPRE